MSNDFNRGHMAGERAECAAIVAWLRMYTRLYALASLLEAHAHELPRAELQRYCDTRGIKILTEGDKLCR